MIEQSARIRELENKALEIRKDIIKLAGYAREGHAAPAFSIVEIMTALYFHRLNLDPENPYWENRDRFILSKGHAVLALYVSLYHAGFIDREKLYTYLQPGTELAGHPIRGKEVPGVEASTGSLGHGFSVAAGFALAAKMDKKSCHTFAVIGDGECNEGSVWETAMVAAHHELDNMTAILDRNHYQCDGYSEVILKLAPLDVKWKGFGWEVRTCDGHNMSELIQLLDQVPFTPGKPSLILANTIKGKGVPFMENSDDWHYRTPLDDDLKSALEILAAQDDSCGN